MPVLFFYLGSPEQGRAFFGRYWPEARAIADPDKRFYAAFELRRGTIRDLFNVRMWGRAIRAFLKGNLAGLPKGDPMMMPGFILVEGDTVVWEYRSSHNGDHPDFARIPALIPLDISENR